MSALAGLPEAVFAIAPELRQIEGLSEPRAVCSACPVSASGETFARQPHMFHADARCCTYHPTLENWLAGRALRHPVSATLIRKRLQQRDGLRVDAIAPHADASVSQKEFGRVLEKRCPYWVGGELACGIWHHRTEVCRTWHCRYSDGERTRNVWFSVKNLMCQVSAQLTAYCSRHSESPAAGASAEEIEAWYLSCADLVDEIPPDDLAALRDDQIAQTAAQLLDDLKQLDQPLPDVLGVAISSVVPMPGGTMRLANDTLRDAIDMPSNIFLFLGRLDGKMSWREALAAARADGLTISDEQVDALYRRDILRLPRTSPDTLGGQIVLNGQVLGSMNKSLLE
jgi:hypothetical protein